MIPCVCLGCWRGFANVHIGRRLLAVIGLSSRSPRASHGTKALAQRLVACRIIIRRQMGRAAVERDASVIPHVLERSAGINERRLLIKGPLCVVVLQL